MLKITRRAFLGAGGLAVTPLIMPRLSHANTSPQRDNLVCIFQRGGADGLNIVVPFGDPDYYAARPDLAIPAPATGAGAALDLGDSLFGLHPAMEPLMGLYASGQLAFVHATGLTDDSHSHFDAQQFMEAGVPGDKTVPDGWVGRHLATLDTGNTSPFRGVALGPTIPYSMRGADNTTAVANFDSFTLTDSERYNAALESMYLGSDALGHQGQLAFAAMDELAAADPGAIVPGASYPSSALGNLLLSAAQLIKSGIGNEVICIDSGGWDTHEGEAAALNALLGDLAASLVAFSTDLGQQMDRTIVVVMTEFGRRIAQNGSLGTDHGYGSLMMLLGGGVYGGQVFTDWPGLANQVGPGDLAITTDYRTVLAEVIDKRLENHASLQTIFPGFEVPSTGFINCCV